MASDILIQARDKIAYHLEEICKLFKQRPKITIVIRTPWITEQGKDGGIVLSDDDFDLAIAEINRLRDKEEKEAMADELEDRGHTLPPQGAAPSPLFTGFDNVYPECICGHRWVDHPHSRGEMCVMAGCGCRGYVGEPAVPPVPAELCENCDQNPATRETDDMVKLCEACWWQTIVDDLTDERDALAKAIKEAIEIIPASMGGHVTLGLNILQATIRTPKTENATLREQLATLHEFSENAVDLAASRKVKIDSLEAALLSAQKEAEQLRGLLQVAIVDITTLLGIAGERVAPRVKESILEAVRQSEKVLTSAHAAQGKKV